MTPVPLGTTIDPDKIRRLVWQYFRDRSERRCSLRYDDFQAGKGDAGSRKDLQEAWKKTSEQAFYRVRSCKTHRQFVDFFSSTICSAPQFFKANEFSDFSRLLLDEGVWEDLKAITMLAIASQAVLYDSKSKEGNL